ncbi:MAG: hypothetical protein LBK99_16460 [Opitutaceae bacterium]|jgi:hypothetical protein|nr:hypothetical protein [Opitutaceae bacterium]
MITDAQKQAGNYPKKHIRVHGLPISIETPRGFIRSGQSANGTPWANAMSCDYGYIRGTRGRDGDHLDVFVGPNPRSELAVIINQTDAAGTFDEHKILLGFEREADAVAAYRGCYPHGWRIGKVVTTSVRRLKQWIRERTTKRKPFEFASRSGMKVYDEKAPPVLPAIAQPKLDGVKAIATRDGLATRTGNPITTQPHLNRRLRLFFLLNPKARLEGELYRHGKPLPEIASAVRHGGSRSSAKLQLHVFPTGAKGEKLPLPVFGIRRVKSTPVSSQANLDKHYRTVLKQGYEGQVIRSGDGTVTKRKPVQDGEFRLVSHRVGKPGKVGSATFVTEGGQKFRAIASPGFTAAPGTLVTIKYQKLTRRGVPRGGGSVVKVARPDDMSARLPAMITHTLHAKLCARLVQFASTSEPGSGDESAIRRNKWRIAGGGLALAGLLAYGATIKRPKTGYSQGTRWTHGWASSSSSAPSPSSAPAKVVRKVARDTQKEASADLASFRKKRAATVRKELRLKSGRIVYFNTQSPDHGNRFAPSLDPLAAYRKGRRMVPIVNRTGDAAQDIADMVAGRKKEPGKKRFYEKAWFKNMAVATAIGGGILAGRHYARVQTNKGNPVRPLFAARLRRQVDLAWGEISSAEARARGWDVRDARGRSARVYAPGSGERQRRKKTWGEKADNLRLVRNIAIAAAGIGLGGAAFYRHKAGKLAGQVASLRASGKIPVKSIVKLPEQIERRITPRGGVPAWN